MSAKRYASSVVEPKWQAYWEDMGLFEARRDPSKPKYYCLMMYPYPSGALHMGHVMNYTIGDVLVRYHLMKGHNVFSPMGWDSFGLPAENAAIKVGIHPQVSIRGNIDTMRAQIRRAGWGYDWSRELATSDPEYYRWTQWLFLKFFHNGLAERKRAPVNWCEPCHTVLANEQVHSGCCERCGAPVAQRDLEQWFFSMSKYAQRLLDNHQKLDGWPERVIKMQQDWVGRSEGAQVDFTIAETGETLSCFTTRPDTLWGVTFMCMAPEHPMIEGLVKGRPQEAEVLAAVREMRTQGTAEREAAETEKVGVFTGCHVVNPVNGEKVPLWVANFAVMTYGTGAVMSVPAHDQRDFEFAKKYGLPIQVVIQPADTALDPAAMTAAYEHDGVQVNSGPFDGRPNREAIPDIAKHLEQIGKGGPAVSYRLRDWLLSRQRYWGAPIPIVYCDACGAVPVPEEDLPVLLPKDVEFMPTGESPLARCEAFVNTPCPACGKPAKRETDTMDTFVDSAWYFLRYCSPRDSFQAFDPKDVAYWMPVDQYVGGIEHATMHLIYCRFFTQVMHDLGLLPFDEPATKLFCQGMVCKVAHYCAKCKWVSEDDVHDGRCQICGGAVTSEVTKMSKSKLNTVSPDEIMANLGADAMRLYVLSDTPPDRNQVWNEDGLHGAHRTLGRLWSTVQDGLDKVAGAEPYAGSAAGLDEPSAALYRKVHETIKRVTENIEGEMHFNTAISAVIELMNETRARADAQPGVLRAVLEAMVVLLSPIVPHMAEELWQDLGHEPTIFHEPWPTWDESALAEDMVELAVQINSKVRGRIQVPADASPQAIEQAALAADAVQKHLAGRAPKKVIVVPGRLVNVVG